MASLSGILLWQVLGMALLASGVLVALWAIFWDRSRGRLRCPKCWYPMEGTHAQSLELLASTRERLRCPECGKVISEAKQLRKTRKRWWLLLPAALLVALAPQALDQPQRIASGETWSRAVPTWAACLFLVSDDINTRTDAKMLLTERRPRCGWIGKRWMNMWRDAGLPLDLAVQLEHRKQVVAGMAFQIDEYALPSWPSSNASRIMRLFPNRRTSAVPPAGFVSRVFSTPVAISETLHPTSWVVMPSHPVEVDGLQEWSSYTRFRTVAPTKPGKHKIHVPVESISGKDVVHIRVSIEVEVIADVNAVLTPQEDKTFESQVAQWMRLRLADDGGARVWYMGVERDFACALTCEVVFEGKVVGTTRRPVLPYESREADMKLSTDIRERLVRVKSKIASPDGWLFRVRGTPEAIHEFTSSSTYWNGTVEIPIAEVLE